MTFNSLELENKYYKYYFLIKMSKADYWIYNTQNNMDMVANENWLSHH